MTKKEKGHFFGPKRAIFEPQKTTKITKIVFLSNSLFYNFLAKFQQKMSKKNNQKYDQKKAFLAQKGPFLHTKKRHKGPNSFSSQTYFLYFLAKLSKKEQKNPKNMAKKGPFFAPQKKD